MVDVLQKQIIEQYYKSMNLNLERERERERDYERRNMFLKLSAE